MILFCIRFADFIEDEIDDKFTRFSSFENEVEIVQSFLNPSPDGSYEDPSVLLSFSNASLFICGFALILTLIKLYKEPQCLRIWGSMLT